MNYLAQFVLKAGLEREKVHCSLEEKFQSLKIEGSQKNGATEQGADANNADAEDDVDYMNDPNLDLSRVSDEDVCSLTAKYI